jgi:hypothetical protein
MKPNKLNKYLFESGSNDKVSSDSLTDEDDNQKYLHKEPTIEEENDEDSEEYISNTPEVAQKYTIPPKPKFIMPPVVEQKLPVQTFPGSSQHTYACAGPQIMSSPPGLDKPLQSVFEYKGQIDKMAMTQQGSKYLQRVLTKASPDVVEFIIQEIGMQLSTLMIDQYGNYF